jgi:hypothetical protein
MKKSELKQLIKEEIQKVLGEVKLEKSKTLLNECWISTTFEDMFEENPQIYNLLKDNMFDMDGDVIKYSSKAKFLDELAAMGGALGNDGIWDWNKPKVLKFFKDLYEIKIINKTTYDALLKELNKVNKVFTMDYLEDMVKRVGNESWRWSNKEEGLDWYNQAKQEVDYIKKGLTFKDFTSRNKNTPGSNTCKI